MLSNSCRFLLKTILINVAFRCLKSVVEPLSGNCDVRRKDYQTRLVGLKGILLRKTQPIQVNYSVSITAHGDPQERVFKLVRPYIT